MTCSGPTSGGSHAVPGAFASALLGFSFIYYVTPDVQQRAVRWITPGALVGVTLWLAASAAFSSCVNEISEGVPEPETHTLLTGP
jgi:uncharacterized BrkB/YihY/UPF0761 family membrane protein